jgi:t-SNARE complex subunit (syntaxin)
LSGVIIKRSVVIKAKVTEKFKKQTIDQIREALDKIELEIEQIEFQGKKLIQNVEKQPLQQLSPLKRKLETEKKKKMELKIRLIEKIREVEQWDLGIEVVEGSVEGYVELQEGDNWEKLMNAEVVVQDGIVIEVRG